jgi:Lar family restriction alleviation protein
MMQQEKENDDELKPCPFCGASAEIIEVEETDNQGGFVVCCTGCQASTKVWFPLKDDATRILRDEWNRRAEQTTMGKSCAAALRAHAITYANVLPVSVCLRLEMSADVLEGKPLPSPPSGAEE